ncbi:hypothetical protein AWH56_021370 [Anaerobacillus isosaccharinicus]|uniref:Uncharacterized protein n=1 Tax=Anaerobacillus isosaccharinicus TaxID=1532552 RepID=A0A1S2LEX4_9BACI|nr:hypothetical protein [Anaerobacillus isosaccharinicus]MBA5586541.1 hypothetical protein [Anaerobacillus isosaccharinicus]QOY35220.1 hypothetical protein AWH56_021370 [Anaerobacillus isosaccharinicus]
MMSKRHVLFNISIIAIPWLSLLFIGRRNFRRYFISGIFIVVFEIVNHLYGNKRKWWKFYDKRKSFLKDELPFSIGPYMPVCMWILKYSYGNFKKFIVLNAIADGLFAFLIIDVFRKLKIVGLNRLSYFQFFIYLHYKAYLLYGVQYLFEKYKGYNLHANVR